MQGVEPLLEQRELESVQGESIADHADLVVEAAMYHADVQPGLDMQQQMLNQLMQHVEQVLDERLQAMIAAVVQEQTQSLAQRLREEMNFSIFVDTPLDICLMRRIKRDVNERGRSMDSVMAQYQKTVRPMFLQFIEPSKQYADIIVPRGGKNRIAIDILKAKISQFFE